MDLEWGRPSVSDWCSGGKDVLGCRQLPLGPLTTLTRGAVILGGTWPAQEKIPPPTPPPPTPPHPDNWIDQSWSSEDRGGHLVQIQMWLCHQATGGPEDGKGGNPRAKS